MVTIVTVMLVVAVLLCVLEGVMPGGDAIVASRAASGLTLLAFVSSGYAGFTSTGGRWSPPASSPPGRLAYFSVSPCAALRAGARLAGMQAPARLAGPRAGARP